MALKQELHRSPFDFFVPHHVDQVDDDRQRDTTGDQTCPKLRAGRKDIFKHDQPRFRAIRRLKNDANTAPIESLVRTKA